MSVAAIPSLPHAVYGPVLTSPAVVKVTGPVTPTFQVTVGTDAPGSGASGDLRWAVTQCDASPTGGIITFAANVKTVTLSYGPLVATGTVTVPSNTVVVNGTGAFGFGQTVLDVTNGATVSWTGGTFEGMGMEEGVLVGNDPGTATATFTTTGITIVGPGAGGMGTTGVFVGSGGVYNPVSGNTFTALPEGIYTGGTGYVNNSETTGTTAPNVFTKDGTAMVLNGGTSSVYDTDIINNSSTGVLNEYASLTLDNDYFANNGGANYGGDLIAYEGTGLVCTIENTTIQDPKNAGMFPVVTVEYSTLITNNVTINAGQNPNALAMFLYNLTWEETNTTVIGPILIA